MTDFSPDAVRELLKAVAGATKGRKNLPMSEAEKAVVVARNDELCIRKFTKMGYKDVRPRENVKTFNRWYTEDGRIVKRGEKSTKVGRFRLFHEDQTRFVLSTDTPIEGKKLPEGYAFPDHTTKQ